MPTLAEMRSHQVALGDLVTLAQAELVKLWRALVGADPRDAAAEVRLFIADASAAYGLAAGGMAADWYDELRAAAGVSGAYLATTAGTPSPETVQATLGWGLAPLFPAPTDPYLMGPEPAPDFDAALSRLSGGLQRLVAGADRSTILTNTRRDPTAVRFARHASANACAFCAVMATRGAVYRSEDTAGDKYHTNCHCVAVPVWPGQEVEEAPYVADWRNAYYDATKELGGARDLKAILAQMRETANLR